MSSSVHGFVLAHRGWWRHLLSFLSIVGARTVSAPSTSRQRLPKRFTRCVRGIAILPRTCRPRGSGCAAGLFNYCVQVYPYRAHEHRCAMAEACRRRGGTPFDLTCIGGRKAQAVARLLGGERVGSLTLRAPT